MKVINNIGLDLKVIQVEDYWVIVDLKSEIESGVNNIYLEYITPPQSYIRIFKYGDKAFKVKRYKLKTTTSTEEGREIHITI